MNILSALWAFPAIVIAAMLIAWAAECGQFFISQGLALAILAWIQTIPEFAVEAVITSSAVNDPSKLHLITANYTGSLRLFVGLGWPMVYFVSLFFARIKKNKNKIWIIRLDDEHSISIVFLLPALAYFLIIYFKGMLTIVDGIVLAAIYFIYLFILSKIPPQDHEELNDLGRIPKRVMRLKPPFNIVGVVSFFIIGAVIIYFAVHPFLDSMLAMALCLGISQFVFVQWVAPFLSEFPEKLSAFYWAKKIDKAPMALINFVSSSINQWTILIAIIPFIYSFGTGKIVPVIFDQSQKLEILLTIIQTYLGFLFLASMDFCLMEAVGLFCLWLIQFLIPQTRHAIVWAYGIWALTETVRLIKNLNQRNAFSIFFVLLKKHIR